MRTIVAYLAALVLFVGLDAVWLTVMGPKLYRPALGALLADKVDVPAAIAFYLVYVAGVIFLAVTPAVREASAVRAGVNGLVLGVVAYATYDLTNQATLKAWSMRLTLADIAWGAFATALAAFAGYHAARLIAR